MSRCCNAVLVSLSLVALLACSGCSRPSEAKTGEEGGQSASGSGPVDEATQTVTAGQAERKTLRRTTTQPGHIEAFETTPIYAKVTGYVQKVHVDIGDSLEKDQPLITLSIPERQDEVNQKQAAVRRTQAEVDQASSAVKAAETAIETAKAKIEEARSGLTAAEAEYERWKSEFERISELAEEGSVSRKLVDETRFQYDSAQASR